MSVRITLTDSHVPPSEQFVQFLDTWLAGAQFDGSAWAKHRFERTPAIGDYPALDGALDRVAGSAEGMRHLARAYDANNRLLIHSLSKKIDGMQLFLIPI